MQAVSENRIRELKEMYGNESIVLHGENVYTPGIGYETDHIPPISRRDTSDHWNAQFAHPEEFRKSWKPRSGPVELVYTLAQEHFEKTGKPYCVVNMGGGIGDFTADLARIPNVQVIHVDFSEQANVVASQLLQDNNIPPEKVSIVNADHKTFLQTCKHSNISPDFIFFYGGLTDNLPKERDTAEILDLAVNVLSPGGFLWYVGLQQPAIDDPTNTKYADILGEYAARPNLVPEILFQYDNMYLLAEETSDRPDHHRLHPDKEPEDHLHSVQRALFGKSTDGEVPFIPKFGFKDAVDPNWETRWKQLLAA